MQAFDAYCLYLAIKSHFTREDYDYFRYNGKVKASRKSFDARKDKMFFEKLAKFPNPESFLVANIVQNPKTYIRELSYSEVAQKVYQDWLIRQQSFTYHFMDVLKAFEPTTPFETYFIVHENTHPPILALFLRDEISLEDMCALVLDTGASLYWDVKLKDDIIWQQTRFKLLKYRPFLKYDQPKIRWLIKDYFAERK